MIRFAAMAFNYGKIGCMGTPVAFMELNKPVTKMRMLLELTGMKRVRRSDFLLLNSLNLDPNLHGNCLFMQTNMWVRILQ